MLRFEKMPSPLPGMQLWGARSNGYSFVISLDEGGKPDPNYEGYVASWKTVTSNQAAANRIDGSPFASFAGAEQACKATWRQLIRKN